MGRRAASLCVLGAVGLALAAAARTWFDDGVAAPAPASAHDGSGGGTAAAAAVPPAVPSTVAPNLARSATRVVGQASLQSGAPIVAWPVRLARTDRRPLPPGRLELETQSSREYPARFTTTGDDGRFAFDDVEPAEYVLSLDGVFDRVAETFRLAAGEQRTVALRAAGVMVQGKLLRAGLPVANARFGVVGVRQRTSQFADASGAFRLLLEPGRYEVHSFSGVWPSALTNTQTKVVPEGVASTSWLVDPGGVDLEVDARDTDGLAAAQFTVRLEGTMAADGERVVREIAGKDGRAMFAQVPAGQWCVTVQAAELVPVAPQELTTTNAIPRVCLRFVGPRAMTVRLRVQQVGGKAAAVDPELLPWLTSGDVLLPCVTLVAGERGRAATIGYRSVPPGLVRLPLEDRQLDTTIQFLPFDALPPVTAQVVIGGQDEIVLDVVPRASLDLRACEATGREDLTASITVFAGSRAARGRTAAHDNRWSGWLPPGDYRVVVDRKGSEREHALRVERSDLTMRYRP